MRNRKPLDSSARRNDEDLTSRHSGRATRDPESGDWERHLHFALVSQRPQLLIAHAEVMADFVYDNATDEFLNFPRT